MELLSIYTKDTNYALEVSMKDGALMLDGHDLSPWLEASRGRDEYEYRYTVEAQHVPKLRAALLDEAAAEQQPPADGTEAALFELLRLRFVVPHGISASTAFKEWLVERAIPYKFSSY